MGRPPRISREQILEAARDAFAERGFAATTLAEIAGELGVTAAAILRHYQSKQELFHAAMSAREIDDLPFVDDLLRTDASADPREVLRRFAKQFVPFISTVLRSAIAVQMHLATRETTTLVVPFDTRADETPPRRVLAAATAYFERAMKARRVRRADPRALALLFLGQLQSYVFIHQILAVKPRYPLDDYLDAMIDLWTGGALAVKTKTSASHRAAGAAARSGRGGGRVRAKATRAETARPLRDAGSAHSQRRVARRRTRHSRSR